MCLVRVDEISLTPSSPPVDHVQVRPIHVARIIRIVRYSNCGCDTLVDDCCWREAFARRRRMLADSFDRVFDPRFRTFVLCQFGLAALIILPEYIMSFFNDRT